MNRFVLIDGNAIMHRAFHALPPLTNKEGVLSNAVYGFFSMFLKIIGDLRPSYIAVCFDRPKPTFRKELYAGYQAKRPKMSDDLAPQIGVVHDMLLEIGVSIFEIDGYEADDLIGTLSKQAVSESAEVVNKTNEIEVIIVSGDRDLLQLVNSHVLMLAPITGITNMILYDEAKVFEKFGVKPSQIIDYKALVGDSSDNYPGVSGIGPKTAKDLISEYETFENLYKNIGKLPEKIATRLATDAEQAALAKKLATIILDAPVTLKLNECSMEKFDRNKARQAFEDIGFKSLLKRLEEISGEVKQSVKQEEKKPQDQQLGLL